jgi:siroheme synthase-like protein
MSGRRALVLGGGRAATFKIRALLRAGAKVTVIAPWLSPTIRTLLRKSTAIEYRARKATPRDVRTCYLLIFPLTSDETLNAKLAQAARRKRIWVGGSSDPEQADFSSAAIVERGPVQLAISTGGTSPTLARLLAMRINDFLKAAFPANFVVSTPTRNILRQSHSDPQKRRQILAKAARKMLQAH